MSAELNVRYALQALRRRLPLLLLCVILVPLAAVAVSLLQPKEYTAKSSLLFRDPQFDQKLFGSTFVQSAGDPTREAATNVELVSLERVAQATAAHTPGMTADDVSNAISVNSDGQSDVVSIEATARSADAAAKLANTFATQYIDFRRDADRSKIQDAEVPLRAQLAQLPKRDREGPLGDSLATRLNQLNVLASLQTGNAELVQPAPVPEGPSSPKTLQNAGFGLAIGLLLGVGFVVLAEALDRRLRDPNEVEQTFERPVLATLPESASLISPDPALRNVAEAEREAFRMLRANLRYFSLSRDIRSVLVTSSDSGDGKSTVAWGLAVAAASGGTRTLLIEGDLRHPSFGSRYKLRTHHGLTSVLTGETQPSEAIKRIALPLGEKNGDATRAMDVLTAGPLPPNPADLFQSRQMARFLEDAGREYELLVIDTPPAAVVSDPIPLLTMVGGVIVVSRLGKTTRDHLRRLHQQLENLDAPILGVVVNSVDKGTPYGYGYHYGYGTPAARKGDRNGAPRLEEREIGTATVRTPSPDNGARGSARRSAGPVGPLPAREESSPVAEADAENEATSAAETSRGEARAGATERARGDSQTRATDQSPNGQETATPPVRSPSGRPTSVRQRLRNWLE